MHPEPRRPTFWRRHATNPGWQDRPARRAGATDRHARRAAWTPVKLTLAPHSLAQHPSVGRTHQPLRNRIAARLEEVDALSPRQHHHPDVHATEAVGLGLYG